MTDQDNLRERLTALILGRTAPTAAQAIIDEFDLTVRGDDCGYHEIYGSYDTRFGK